MYNEFKFNLKGKYVPFFFVNVVKLNVCFNNGILMRKDPFPVNFCRMSVLHHDFISP